MFESEGTHTVKAIYWKGSNYYFSPTISVDIVDNTYKITPTFPETMYYKQHDFTCTLTYGGQPVEGETITFLANGLSYSKLTDENGEARLNNNLPPNTYDILMSYSEDASILAKVQKECKILKGNVAMDMMSSDYIEDPTQPKSRVTKGGYVIFNFTNYLDPDDDDVTAEETLVTGGQIVITVNGMDYIRVTDEYGNAKLNINLNQGVYDVTVSFAGNMHYNGNIKKFELSVIE